MEIKKIKKWLKGRRLAEMVDERKIVKKVDRAKRTKELEEDLEKEATPLMEEYGITKDEAMLYVQAKRREVAIAEKMKQMKEGLGKFQDFADMRVGPAGSVLKKRGLKDEKEKE